MIIRRGCSSREGWAIDADTPRMASSHTDTCARCFKPAPNKCPCGTAWYCSTACQRKDWELGHNVQHKRVMKARKREKAAAAAAAAAGAATNGSGDVAAAVGADGPVSGAGAGAGAGGEDAAAAGDMAALFPSKPTLEPFPHASDCVVRPTPSYTWCLGVFTSCTVHAACSFLKPRWLNWRSTSLATARLASVCSCLIAKLPPCFGLTCVVVVTVAMLVV